MNSVVVFPHELNDDGMLVLEGARAVHLLHAHKLTPGITVRAAVLTQGMGTIEVMTVDAARPMVQAKVVVTSPPWPRVPLVLIVAFARPQTVKKLLHIAAVSGIEEVHFIRTARIQKSYMSSHVLQESARESVLLKAIEQSGDAQVPQVVLHDRFKPFVEDYLPQRFDEDLSEACRVLADPRGPLPCDSLVGASPPRAVVALGPEAGWEDHERQAFEAVGFSTVHVGPRILRVEDAAAKLCAQLELVVASAR